MKHFTWVFIFMQIVFIYLNKTAHCGTVNLLYLPINVSKGVFIAVFTKNNKKKNRFAQNSSVKTLSMLHEQFKNHPSLTFEIATRKTSLVS